jgi:hypothetical protein
MMPRANPVRGNELGQHFFCSVESIIPRQIVDVARQINSRIANGVHVSRQSFTRPLIIQHDREREPSTWERHVIHGPGDVLLYVHNRSDDFRLRNYCWIKMTLERESNECSSFTEC